MPLSGANWRTMMATFVTRMERDHEALLDTLRERLDEAETEQRRLEARVAELEARLTERPPSSRRPRTVVVRRPHTPEERPAFPAAAKPPPAAAVPHPAAAPPAPAAAQGAPETAAADGGPPWQDSARAILVREAEVVDRARKGQSAMEIAAALGRGVGEVQLVLRLAERAHHAMGAGRPGQSHEEAI
jgi:cell division septum initiation protein DivIVA